MDFCYSLNSLGMPLLLSFARKIDLNCRAFWIFHGLLLFCLIVHFQWVIFEFCFLKFQIFHYIYFSIKDFLPWRALNQNFHDTFDSFDLNFFPARSLNGNYRDSIIDFTLFTIKSEHCTVMLSRTVKSRQHL